MASAPHQTIDSTRKRRVALAAAAGLGAAVLALAGCSSSDDNPTSTPSSASVSPTAPDLAAGEKTKVLAVVKGMHDAQTVAYQKGTEQGTGLETYAADKALAGIRAELFNYKQNSVIFHGGPQFTQSQVTAIDLARSPKTAAVQECIDTSNWTPVKRNGDKVPVYDTTRRYVVTESVRTIGTDWRVVSYELDKSRPC